MKHDFKYVTKNEARPYKEKLEKIIHELQDLVRDDFTFSYRFVGSSARNMITYDHESNVGFDFDVNIYPNDDDEEFSAQEIKCILMNALNSIVTKYGYDYCEDSTRVITIKVKDTGHSKILHSCDFAIVYDCEDGSQQYIRFNKSQNSYTWEYQEKGFKGLNEKTQKIKQSKLWNEVKKTYLYKKNYNTNDNKHSRSIYGETINEIYNRI